EATHREPAHAHDLSEDASSVLRQIPSHNLAYGGELIVGLARLLQLVFFQVGNHPDADLRKGSRRRMDRAAHSKGVSREKRKDGAREYPDRGGKLEDVSQQGVEGEEGDFNAGERGRGYSLLDLEDFRRRDMDARGLGIIVDEHRHA